MRIRGVRRTEATHGYSRRRCCPRLLDRPRLRDRRVTRHTLLQEHLRGLHAWVGVKALDHDLVAEDVGKRDERHALVVGHEGPHDSPLRRVLPCRDAAVRVVGVAVRVVDGVVVAVRSCEPGFAQVPQVLDRLCRLEHRRERRSIGSHHQLVTQSSLEAQTRHAEGLVLVPAVAVHQVVGAL